MKKGKVALYTPYLDILGGGEKHILSILKALEDEGCEITIFWDRDLKLDIEKKLHLRFKRIRFRDNIFARFSIQKYLYLHNFDYFFYVTDGSYFFPTAKKNYTFAMVPKKKLYISTLGNRIKTKRFLFIANSKFTKLWLEEWHIKSTVIYPYVDNSFFARLRNKEDIILTVGRFFRHLHTKNQVKVIELFKKLIQTHKMFKKFRLYLVGGLTEHDKSYFKYLQTKVKDEKNIIIEANLSFRELVALYRKSKFFWHFTGYGLDENKYPELVEHLGISPLEAMAAGCVTFCYEAGGPKEIIKDRINGFLFKNEDELLEKMKQIATHRRKFMRIQRRGREFVKENFNYDVLRKRVREVILV